MLQHYLWMAGPIVFPLLACSVLVLALIVERLVVLSLYPSTASKTYQKQFEKRQWGNASSGGGVIAGLQLLDSHRDKPKHLREEFVSLWLQQQRRKLLARTRWLVLLGALSPLLGLLGTVLGIITMFQDVAHQAGPVTPAILASGMWEAMVTTALGLFVAIPAIVASQVFSIWGDHRIEKMEQALNDCSLLIDQIQLKQVFTGEQSDKVIRASSFQQTVEEQTA